MANHRRSDRGGPPPPPPPPPQGPQQGDVVIVVMGLTGSGKSSFISQFRTDRLVGIGFALESYTTQIEIYRCEDQHLRQFWLIDTPGFDDTYLTDTQVLGRVAVWLNAAYQSRIQLTGIVYLHDIRANKISASIARNFEWFQQLCGENAMRKVVLVTSFWDCVPSQLPADVAHRREAELRQSEFWGDMVNKGARTSKHYNTLNSARDVIRMLLDIRTSADSGVDLQIQVEMQHPGTRLEQTTVGRSMQRHKEEEQSYFDQEIHRLEEELRDCLKSLDEQHRLEVERDRRDFEKKREELRQDQLRLRASIAELDQSFQSIQEQSSHRREAELRRLLERERQLERENAGLGRQQDELAQTRRQRKVLQARRVRIQQIQGQYWCNTQ